LAHPQGPCAGVVTYETVEVPGMASKGPAALGDLCAKSIPEYQQDAEYAGEDIIPGDGAIHAIPRRGGCTHRRCCAISGCVPNRALSPHDCASSRNGLWCARAAIAACVSTVPTCTHWSAPRGCTAPSRCGVHRTDHTFGCRWSQVLCDSPRQYIMRHWNGRVCGAAATVASKHEHRC
jgi:hypothetical protein